MTHIIYTKCNEDYLKNLGYKMVSKIKNTNLFWVEELGTIDKEIIIIY